MWSTAGINPVLLCFIVAGSEAEDKTEDFSRGASHHFCSSSPNIGILNLANQGRTNCKSEVYLRSGSYQTHGYITALPCHNINVSRCP